MLTRTTIHKLLTFWVHLKACPTKQLKCLLNKMAIIPLAHGRTMMPGATESVWFCHYGRCHSHDSTSTRRSEGVHQSQPSSSHQGHHGQHHTMMLLHAAVLYNVYLTPSMPAVQNFCALKGSAPYWSNPLFLIFDIWALWRSVLSARAPECQNLKMVN